MIRGIFFDILGVVVDYTNMALKRPAWLANSVTKLE